jgi:glycosyltransferase involved in cell wall biosynthesis
MKILVLTPQPLVPLQDGLNLRVYHLFRELARAHDVWVLFLIEGDANGREDDMPEAGFKGCLGVPIRGVGGLPFRHCRDFAPEAERAIKGFLAHTPIDIIVAESVYMAPYARRLLDRPVLIDLIDNNSLLARSLLWSQPNWRERVRRLREWRFWRNYERQHLPAFPYLTTVSPRDARVILHRAPQAAVSVIPNGVDTEFFQPLTARSDVTEVVFTGVMGFSPNEAAAIYFYTRIFPRVRAAIPGVRFTIAGKGPTQRLQQMVGSDPGVTLTGYVEDMRSSIGQAAVYVAPMVSGAGIKNKILEAWAMARPVVTTSLACESLEGAPGETHFIADSPDGFADAVIHLLQDRAHGDEVGRRARRLVLDRYRWSVQAEQLSSLLESIARRWCATASVPNGLGFLG